MLLTVLVLLVLALLPLRQRIRRLLSIHGRAVAVGIGRQAGRGVAPPGFRHAGSLRHAQSSTFAPTVSTHECALWQGCHARAVRTRTRLHIYRDDSSSTQVNGGAARLPKDP